MALPRWIKAWLLPGAAGLLAMAGVCLLIAGLPIFALPQHGVPKAEARAHRPADWTILSAEGDAPVLKAMLSPIQSPGSARGEVERNVRWDLMAMAGAGRGSWEPKGPCPIYAIDTPNSGPR